MCVCVCVCRCLCVFVRVCVCDVAVSPLLAPEYSPSVGHNSKCSLPAAAMVMFASEKLAPLKKPLADWIDSRKPDDMDSTSWRLATDLAARSINSTQSSFAGLFYLVLFQCFLFEITLAEFVKFCRLAGCVLQTNRIDCLD